VSAFSKPRLARMADVMRGYVERGVVPGVVTLLARRGAVHVETFGVIDRDSGVPMARETIFRIASMTKPMTAVAAMMLVEEAKLRLDDPVDPWLPELADRRVLKTVSGPLEDTVPAKRPITLRDLLTLRLGIGMIMEPSKDWPIQQAMDRAGVAPDAMPPTVTADEVMRAYGSLPLQHQPGERWLYHNGSDILGVLVARASGMPLEDFLAERIFTPLGMADTAFSVPEAKLDRLATCYELADGRLSVFDAARGGRWSKPPGFAAGGGGLVSSADDCLAFNRMLLAYGRHGTQRLLARPTVEAMVTDQITPEQKAASPFFPGFWDNQSWGLGVGLVTRRDSISAVPGRFGWSGGLGTSAYADPREDLVGILMTQCVLSPPLFRLIEDFWTLAYQAIED
jgi:CubicO group peptidase (beta-lactamase class C family)